jgi:hypothetical protein
MRASIWIILTVSWAAVCVVLVTAAAPPLGAEEAQVRPNPPPGPMPSPPPGPAPAPTPGPVPGPNPPPLNPTDGGR